MHEDARRWRHCTQSDRTSPFLSAQFGTGDALWEYKSYHWAGLRTPSSVALSLDGWLKRAHGHLILNWFAAKKEFSSGIVEGLNDRLKLTIRKAYGFKTLETAEIALYHTLGRLPEPKLAHEFC